MTCLVCGYFGSEVIASSDGLVLSFIVIEQSSSPSAKPSESPSSNPTLAPSDEPRYVYGLSWTCCRSFSAVVASSDRLVLSFFLRYRHKVRRRPQNRVRLLQATQLWHHRISQGTFMTCLGCVVYLFGPVVASSDHLVLSLSVIAPSLSPSAKPSERPSSSPTLAPSDQPRYVHDLPRLVCGTFSSFDRAI